MSKPAQKQRKGKAAVAPEPTPILLQQESASAAPAPASSDSDDDNAVTGKDDDSAAMPHADMFFSTQAGDGVGADASAAAAGTGSEMAMLTQQLQLMQQIIMMQQQQMQQQLQQHKAELEETKKLVLGGTPASPSQASDASASVDTPAFTSFRTSVPPLPHQRPSDYDSDAVINTLRGRLGVVNDSIIAPSSRQDFSHLTEFQLGSRYVIKGLGLM